MITKLTGGMVISEGKKFESDIYLKDDKIFAITNDKLDFDKEIDISGKNVSAGFIDIHIHGAGNCDFLDNTEEAYLTVAKTVAEHGATSIIPTVTSSTKEEMQDAISVFEKVKNVQYDGANMLGLHYEGPYFSPEQKGAQKECFLRNFDIEEYGKILEGTDCVLRWTAAPELPGSAEFGKYLTDRGILPCIGHSNANGQEVEEAFKNGFSLVTHLYSCTSIVHRKNGYRYIGIVEAAYLNDDMFVEIIADGTHLPADLLKLIYKIKGPKKTILVTDSMRGAGMPDGPSMLGGMENGLEVIIEDDVAKLPDRTAFAGSVAFCDRLVRNMIKLANVSIEDAVMMATQTPAEALGIKNKGIIKEGFDADLVVFDDDVNVYKTFVGGRAVYTKD